MIHQINKIADNNIHDKIWECLDDETFNCMIGDVVYLSRAKIYDDIVMGTVLYDAVNCFGQRWFANA